MNHIKKYIENFWYTKKPSFLQNLLFLIMSPICCLFQLISFLRKVILSKYSLSVNIPIIVIGNITVGGNGKTRLCLFLAEKLTKLNYPVGVILRGYGGTNKSPKLVQKNDDSSEVGDEALIYALRNLPVVCGVDRHAAANYLLEQHPEIKFIICDDGLQHYKLQRDFEICVVDSKRLFGNSNLLPCGPLREPISRLKTVNVIFIQAQSVESTTTIEQNAIALVKTFNQKVFLQKFVFMGLFNPISMQHTTVSPHKKIYIVSALGDNDRFINYIKSSLNINEFTILSFPDHYQYKKQDLPQDGAIITTEKDYVKMKKFNKDNIWIVQSDLHIDNFDSIISEIIQLKKNTYEKQ